MRKQDLIIFIGIIVFVAILFVIYVLANLFAPKESVPVASHLPRSSSTSRPFPSFNTPPSNPPTPLPLPDELPSPLAQPDRQSLIDQLPLQTDFANIEYLSRSDSFAITIKKNPYKENRSKIESWFKEQGFNPSDLNIYWQTYPEVVVE